MMQIVKPGTKIDFMGKTKYFIIAFAVVIVLSFALIFGKGFNLGIDFAGGTVVQVKFEQPVHLDDIRNVLRPVINGDFVLQNFGDENEVLVRIVELDNIGLQELSDNVKDALAAGFKDNAPTIQRVEQVGPQVGDELRSKAFFAMLYACIGILIYIAFRFELLFGVGAVIALVHDVIFTMGIYALVGKEFNITVMAALLTAAGYSLNDKIVVFDRIREKIKSAALEKHTWKEVVNMSVNETLSRTILTSLLTFLAVLSLYVLGGEVINGFALIMMLGIIIGTYSSVGVAATFVCYVRTHYKSSSKTKKKGLNAAPKKA